MTHNYRRFVLIDPTDIDGNPYEAAELAIGQLHGMILLMEQHFEATQSLVLSAEMERQLYQTKTCDVRDWDSTPQGRRWAELKEKLSDVSKDLRILRQAAGFDPKKKLPSGT